MAQGTTKGVPIDTDPLLTADSDLLVPSQKAVKSYAQPQLNGTGFVKATGTTISYDNSTYLTSVGTGVINELTYWSGTNTIGSLATSTYPSLTELSYVKGVTSSIQTQIGNKVTANGAISGATNLKITYDSKGLVTSGTTAATSDLSDVTAWTDYSATSTIVGFTTYSVKKIQYKKIDANTMIIQFQIESTAGNGSGTSTSFTLPFNASSWGTQYFIYHSLNNTTTQAASVATIPASSNVVTFSSNASTGTAWTNATTRHIQGTLIINIA
jgi:hypothetical protein